MIRANPKGYGTPYVKVWGSDNKLITQQIDNFTYKYSEDGDDIADITFKTKDLFVRDEMSFQDDARWKIQWGWLPTPEYPKGIHSNVRTIYLREIKTKYDFSGVTIKIQGTDGASFMNQLDPRGQGLFQNVTLGQMLNTFTEQLGLKVVYDTDAFLDANGKLSVKAYRMGGPINRIKFANLLNTLRDPKGGRIEPKRRALGLDEFVGEPIQLDASNTILHDPRIPETHSGGEIDAQPLIDMANLPDTFVLHEDFFCENTVFKTIKKLLNEEAVGGLKVYGRDDLLVMTRRNLAKKPIHIYEFTGNEDGELLSFEPQSKRLKKTKAAKHRIGQWNTRFKEKIVQFVDAKDQTNVYMDQLAKLDPNIITSEELELYKQTIEGFSIGKKFNITPSQYKLITKDVNTILEGCQITFIIYPLDRQNKPLRKNKDNPPTTFGQVGNPDTFDTTNFSGYYRGYVSIKGNRQQTISNPNNKAEEASVIQNIVNSKDAGFLKTSVIDNTSVGITKEILRPLRKTINLGTNDEKKINSVLNDLEKAEHDLNPATFLAVGQPRLESSEVIIINNVAKRDAGRYWIKEITHTISKSNGYTMSGQLTRNAVGVVGNESLDKTTEAPDDEAIIPPYQEDSQDLYNRME
jgi:hypothetical protein